MKRLIITEEEKKHILNLYEQATVEYNTTHDKAFDYKKENDKVYFKGKTGEYATKYPNWTEATIPRAVNAIKAITNWKPTYDEKVVDNTTTTTTTIPGGNKTPDDTTIDDPKVKPSGNTDTQDIISQPNPTEPPKPSGIPNMMSNKELRQNKREQNKILKRAERQLKRADKNAEKNCLTYFTNFEKFQNDILAGKGAFAGQSDAYLNFLNTCCDILTENGKNLTGKPFCQATTNVQPSKTNLAPDQDNEARPA